MWKNYKQSYSSDVQHVKPELLPKDQIGMFTLLQKTLNREPTGVPWQNEKHIKHIPIQIPSSFFTFHTQAELLSQYKLKKNHSLLETGCNLTS